MLSPAKGITSATLYVDGVPYTMAQNGNGSFEADSAGAVDASTVASATKSRWISAPMTSGSSLPTMAGPHGRPRRSLQGRCRSPGSPPTSQGTMVGDYISTSFSGGAAYPTFAVTSVSSGDVFAEATFTAAE